MFTSTAYLTYIVISAFITIFVASTLSKNGKLYLIDGFNGDKELAGSVNHMLVVGFYLLNLGFVLLRMRTGVDIQSMEHLIVYISSGLGVVLIVLGLVHFFNMYVINKFRRGHIERANQREHARAQVENDRKQAPTNATLNQGG